VIVPVLSFNLGVEVGQLAIVALQLPLLAWIRRPSQPGADFVNGGCGGWRPCRLRSSVRTVNVSDHPLPSCSRAASR
jgi:hypothetical protein